jgi:hypothetical protein
MTSNSNSIGGTITSADLKGPIEDKQDSDLVKLIGEGRAYSSVSTVQNPRGENRGQLLSSSSPDTTSTDDANLACASSSETASSSASATALKIYDLLEPSSHSQVILY